MKPLHTPSTGLSALVGWFAVNPVAANLLMLLILFGGTGSLLVMEREVFPHFSPHQIEIKALYPGAGPLEIEESVCVRIEEAVYDLPGIKRLASEMVEGLCTVNVTVLPGYEKEYVLSAVRGRVQSLQRLPKELERIDIQPGHRRGENGVIWVALHGNSSPLELKQFGDRIQSDLARLPGVTRALNYFDVPYEIAIQVSSDKLRRYRLSLHEVTEAVRRAALDLPGGLIKSSDGEILIRASGKLREGKSLGRLVLLNGSDGRRILLRDVAEIKDGLQERLSEWHHNGETAQGWEIHADHNTVEVARRVKDYVKEMIPRLPQGLALYTWWDDSQSYDERVGTLIENGFYGFIAVCVILTLFLQFNVAAWASIGIVTSMFGAFWMMNLLGISLNMLSLFGFILAIGILVDDAIIVGEAIHREKNSLDHDRSGAVTNATVHNKEEPLVVDFAAAAIHGTRKVMLPVILAVSTTIAAFIPGLFVPGWAGEMMRPICGVMIGVLLFSLVEALFILPAHLARPSRNGSSTSRLDPLRNQLNYGLAVFIRRVYGPLLKKALAWRYLTVSVFFILVSLSIALVAGGHERITLQADVTKSSFSADLKLPQDAPYSEARRLAQRVEQALLTIRGELGHADGQPSFYSKRCGDIQPDPSMIVGLETIVREHGAGFWTELSADGRQCIVVESFIREWRRRIGDIGSAKIDFIYKEGDVPYDLEFNLGGVDSAELVSAVEQFKKELNGYAGVYDVIDSAEAGKPEVRLHLKPLAERLGMRLNDVAEQVRHGYYGDEAYRVQRGRNEVRVMVRLPLEERLSVTDLRRMPIMLPSGKHAPLETLAELELIPGFAKLTREDRRRVLKVQARLAPGLADVNEIYTSIQTNVIPRLKKRFSGLSLEIGEERKEQERMFRTLIVNASVALLVIYGLIAVPFRSYLMPLILLLAAPVAWCGAIWVHWLVGLPLSMESLVGMIAASGVVVNDSLVLLDFIRRHENDGTKTELLVYRACSVRFRPILLAFLTTFAGFLPTLLETSEQAQFLVPMTLSLASGLLAGMSASLILAPVCYSIFNGNTPLNDKIFPHSLKVLEAER